MMAIVRKEDLTTAARTEEELMMATVREEELLMAAGTEEE